MVSGEKAESMSIIGFVVELWAKVEQRCFHPSLFNDGDELARARLMLVTCLVLCVFLIPVVFLSLYQRPEELLVNVVVLSGHICVMLTFILLRFFETTRVPAHVITVVATIQLLNGALWSGGSESVVLYSYPLAPLFFGLLGRVAHGVVSALFLVSGLCIFYYMGSNGIRFGTFGPTLEVDLLTLGWATMTGLGMAAYAQILSSRMTLRLRNELKQRAQAEQSALAARETKEWFIGYLSHEMRTPLSVMAGGVDLLSRAESEADRNRHLKVLKSASAGMARLMDDVLDISALEGGQIKLQVDEVDVVALAKAVHHSFNQRAREKGLALEMESTVSTVVVLGDEQRLRQILSNLVDNALKFTSSGGVLVSLEIENARVRVQVSDTGPGIAVVDRSRIFEPFARVGQGGTRGAGLGLAIARMLTQQMGSTLHLDSVEGEGCSFWFELNTA